MSLKKIIIFVFVFYTLGFYAQEKDFDKPNYKKTKKLTSQKKSNYYYPKLMKRYLQANDAMTLKEKRHLYYGFTFQKNYKPYAKSKQKPLIRKLLAKPKKTNLEYRELLRQTDLHLLKFPFDIKVLKVKIYAFKMLRQKYDVLKTQKQIAVIKDVLISSGNGKTEKTAFHVINTNHEYELLKILGYQQKGIRQSINKYEYIKLAPNKNHVKGLYFNLTQGIKSVNNKIKPKKKRFF